MRLSDQAEYLFFFLALIGGITPLYQWARTRSPAAALKCFPLLICLGAIAGYMAVSFFKPVFGHQRNFFYLLGPYVILAATSVCLLPVSSRRLVFPALALLLAVTGIGRNLRFFDAMYVNRAKVEYAASVDAPIVAVEQQDDIPLQFGYHVRRDAAGKNVILLTRSDLDRQLPLLLSEYKRVGWIAEEKDGIVPPCRDDMRDRRSFTSFPFSSILPRTRWIVSCVISSDQPAYRVPGG